MKPTIISQIIEKKANSDTVTVQENKARSVRQIIRPEVSEEMRNALYNVLSTNHQYEKARVE
jgi:cell division protein FtsI/penicillin-binding protein 2